VSLNLVPDKIINSIYELDGAELYRKGVRLLLADLDNTIARYAQPEPDEALRLWVRGM
jgi:predicted HAD superfamily phosphohydrolase YqeG